MPRRWAGSAAAPPEYRLEQGGRQFRFQTRPGVFSAGGPDEGTLLLLEAVLPAVKPHQTVLDLGTGAGLLGIVVAPLLIRGGVWMVDVDIRATRAAERNVSLNGVTNAHVVLSDGAGDLPDKLRFDLVLSNPPTHDGREVLAQLVDQSFGVLRPGGSLWIVVNRLLSVKAIMAARFGNVEVAARRKGFLVLRSSKERSPGGLPVNVER